MWTEVAKLRDFQRVPAQIIEHKGNSIALLKSESGYHAIDNTCPHQGGPLAEGYVENGRVSCPWHAWEFDLATGACQTVPGILQKIYEVKVENDAILIDLP